HDAGRVHEVAARAARRLEAEPGARLAEEEDAPRRAGRLDREVDRDRHEPVEVEPGLEDAVEHGEDAGGRRRRRFRQVGEERAGEELLPGSRLRAVEFERPLLGADDERGRLLLRRLAQRGEELTALLEPHARGREEGTRALDERRGRAPGAGDGGGRFEEEGEVVTFERGEIGGRYGSGAGLEKCQLGGGALEAVRRRGGCLVRGARRWDGRSPAEA